MKIGLKLWSTDTSFIPEAAELRIKKIFDYIELYVVPYSYDSTASLWKETGIDFVIHAPHTAHGVNLANDNLRKSNLKIYSEVKRFCDTLQSPYIVVHGGSDGTLDETIYQLRMLRDERIRLENKPLKGLKGELCKGCSPEEFRAVHEAGVLNGITLDFGHAIYYSASCRLDYRNIISEFLKFTPSVFHLSDGYYNSHTDVHLNIGKGEFDITELLNIVADNGMVSIETPRSSKVDLHEFIEDVRNIRLIKVPCWNTEV